MQYCRRRAWGWLGVTIAVAIKVVDGIVLAADSATTLSRPAGPGQAADVVNIYNHANKIVNLHKGAPVGFMTWGMGGFGDANMATLAKDFRAEVWPAQFDASYTVRDVAQAFCDYLRPMAEAELRALAPESRGFGFLVAGHSPSQHLGEGWVVESDLVTGALLDPTEVLQDRAGMNWWGQPRWIQRLVLGADLDALAQTLIDDYGVAQADLVAAFNRFKVRAGADFVHPAMPIQDAINVGRFMVEATKSSIEFCSGDLVVGGPTEIAAITKHEGFKWVSRKHYYNRDLNP